MCLLGQGSYLSHRAGKLTTDTMFSVSDILGFTAEMNSTQLQHRPRHRDALSVDTKKCRQRAHDLREPTVQVGVVCHL